MDNELSGYELSGYENVLNKNVSNKIQKGDFGRIVASGTEVDIVYIVRKALCDFGQYLNGILKNGGYAGEVLTKDNTINPTNDYPFICLHGDQPAAALNMWLLYTIDNANVNEYSHTVYASETSLYNTSIFANKFGNLLEMPTKRLRVSGGSGGSKGKLDSAIDILNRFFRLSILFKMPSEHFGKFNDFCSTYFLKGTKNYDNYYKELNELGSIVLQFSDIPLPVIPLTVMPLHAKSGLHILKGIRKTSKVVKIGNTGKKKPVLLSQRERRLRGIKNLPGKSRVSHTNLQKISQLV